MLDYRYHTFMALAECLNYTKTAKKLNMTQPAVTKHIQYLEELHGVQLVQYQDRVLTLTNKGKLLLSHLLKLQSEINVIVEQLEQKEEANLTIGASKTIGEFYLLPQLTSLKTKIQIPSPSLIVDHTNNLLQMLDQHEIDLAFISGPFEPKNYYVQPFLHHPVVLVCHPDHPFAHQTVSLEDLIDEHLLLRENGAGMLDTLSNFLKEESFNLQQFKHRTTIGNIHLAKNLIKAKQGIGFFYQMAVKDELERNELAPIYLEHGEWRQSFYIVTHPEYLALDRVKQLVQAIPTLIEE